ncbi:hypothetical protein JTB14_027256 [Gonioctena quinquepunctata]|nr:hypothetical protein JTB14_027256 [Gonioctena quinquepunctata]
MHSGTKPEKSNDESKRSDKTSYQSKIGSLLYIAMSTRPDITYAVNVMSQFSSDPSVEHSNMVQHIFRYLKGSKNKRLAYNKTYNPKLVKPTDASYADSLDDRKSHSGYIGFYGNAAVTWTSKKLRIVAVSTTEAEYMALSLSCRKLMWMSYVLEDLKNNIHCLLRCDNQAAIHISSNQILHSRSKHIDVHFHYVRERIIEKAVDINYISTKENVADSLTEPLGKN